MWGLSTEAIATVALFVLAAIGSGISLLIGGVWWMSAMYSSVKNTGKDVGVIKKDIHDMKDRQHSDNVEVWKQMNENGRNIVELDTRLTGVEDRVECLEGKP
jgi:hypothetical protein